MRFVTKQVLACVGLGAILGFIAAKQDFTHPSRAEVATQSAGQAVERGGMARQGRDRPTVTSEGGAGKVLLAQAGEGTTRANAAPAPSGKKPNIVFIMGDDVGWFN